MVPFYNFRHWHNDTVKSSQICLILGFLNKNLLMIGFNKIRIENWRWSLEQIVFPNFWRFTKVLLRRRQTFETKASICPSTLHPNFGRYIRSNLCFSEEEADVRKKRSHLSQHATSQFLKRFPSTKGTFWVIRNFLASFRKTTWASFKRLQFLRFTDSADCDRSRLVIFRVNSRAHLSLTHQTEIGIFMWNLAHIELGNVGQKRFT